MNNSPNSPHEASNIHGFRSDFEPQQLNDGEEEEESSHLMESDRSQAEMSLSEAKYRSTSAHPYRLPPRPYSSAVSGGARRSAINNHHNSRKTPHHFSANQNLPQPQPWKNHESQKPNLNGGGDAFLQWSQKKRSNRTAGDKFSSSHTLPSPPPPATGGGSCSGGGTEVKPHSISLHYSRDSSISSQRMGGGNGSPPSQIAGGSRSRSALGKRPARPLSPFAGGSSAPPPAAEADNAGGKCDGDEAELPMIQVGLTKKEKEEDFIAMRGTKLPFRPKKRPKAVEKSLQCCFPGMWLSDLTRARYEVRVRKNAKKPRQRGLKGLEGVDSESE